MTDSEWQDPMGDVKRWAEAYTKQMYRRHSSYKEDLAFEAIRLQDFDRIDDLMFCEFDGHPEMISIASRWYPPHD